MESILIDTDESLEKHIAKQLVVDVIKTVARQLHESDIVDFDVFLFSEEMNALLSDICFFAFASMEDRGGIPVNNDTYLFNPV
ncbi:hypothetical protein [Vibrio agarivorans]|uniref:Uncharacterized protein n=1 Tax=Vibrio agarivorans TaxID=153622 RepID=A0ABT7XYV8_9VIBR|nr:hypothetical protein [Vibrio agarivorans]MDN2480972.1 hypothetical protein [Vibrio agarivorans]